MVLAGTLKPHLAEGESRLSWYNLTLFIDLFRSNRREQPTYY